MATTLSLLLLGAVIQIFGKVSESITDSRAMLESAERLRLASTRLQQDLAGITAPLNPPLKPEMNLGYFEYIEGAYTQANVALAYAVNGDTGAPDTTVGDFDDILMFTTRSAGRPFVGKFGNGTIQSDVAEVAWFIRGRTLHRRVLLVAPGILVQRDTSLDGVLQSGELSLTAITAFYAGYDVSVRAQGTGVVPNTLGDLTRRECRFARIPDSFPFEARIWGTLGLPTLRECSATTWDISLPASTFSFVPGRPGNPEKTSVDFWANGTSNDPGNTLPWADDVLGSGSRTADDVILTHVIGFDVKAWDPIVGRYVDLGDTLAGVPYHKKSGMAAPGVYDTWSTHYESVGTGLSGDLPAGNGINGFDDPGFADSDRKYNADGSVTFDPLPAADGIVDSADEMLTSPPYPVPLRGIQVKIRVFEPDSRQIREVTVIQDFPPL